MNLPSITHIHGLQIVYQQGPDCKILTQSSKNSHITRLMKSVCGVIGHAMEEEQLSSLKIKASHQKDVKKELHYDPLEGWKFIIDDPDLPEGETINFSLEIEKKFEDLVQIKRSIDPIAEIYYDVTFYSILFQQSNDIATRFAYCHRILSSSIYEERHLKLCSDVDYYLDSVDEVKLSNHPLAITAYTIKKLLETPLQGFRGPLHKDLINHIRHFNRSIKKIEKLDPPLEFCKNTIERICYLFYTGSPKYLISLTREFYRFAPAIKMIVDPDDVSKTITRTYDILLDHSKLAGYVGDYENPHEKGDVPITLWNIKSYKDKKKILIPVLRTPCIVYRNNKEEKYKTAPEFKSNLCYSHDIEPSRRHLYVCLLNRICEEEKPLSRKIEKLDTSSKYSDKIDVLTLNVDDEFYFQDGKYSTMVHAEEFMKAFFEVLFAHSEKSGYYWTSKLEGEKKDYAEWKEKCNKIIHKIHEQHFAKKEILTVHERKIFINYVHFEIIYKYLKKYHPSALNISCFMTVDRGASYLAGFKLYTQIRRENNFNKHTSRKVNVLLHVPSILHVSRPIIQHRMERIADFAAHFCPSSNQNPKT